MPFRGVAFYAAGVLPKFLSGGSIGTAQSSTANQASFDLVTNQAVAIGELAVIIIACDNFASVDGDEGAVTSISDGANTWTKAKEFCNSQGGAQAGATVSIWYTKATTQINNGATITVNLSNATSRDKTCATAWKWYLNGGSTLAVEATNTLANDAGDPGSLDATTANLECLRIRGIAAETSSVTALTVTNGWTKFTDTQTAGGSAATNMAVRGEWIESTGTGAASDPTYTAVDCASAYAAFKYT